MKRSMMMVCVAALICLTACGCKHEWVEATCETPQTCSLCGEVEGTELGHTWLEDTKVCSVCYYSEWPITYAPIYDENVEYLNIAEQNRVQNDSTFYIKDGWIYGQSWDKSGNSQFVKVRTDFTDWTVLDKGLASRIYVVDNYIYYMLFDKDYGIYRMKTSGEDKQLLVKAFGSMQIVGDDIYYTDYMYKGKYDDTSGDDSCYHLYKCNLNGEDVTEIIDKPTFHAYVFDDAILYQDDRDNMSLHICDLNGQNDVKLNDSMSFWPIYDGNYIYYVRAEEFEDSTTRTIWRIRPDGTGDQKVASYQVSNAMLMTAEHIYFVNGDDSDRLYRIDKDGENLTLITQDTNLDFVDLFDNQIKYTKYAKNYQYIDNNYFCDYDGSGKWAFEK